MSIDRLDGKLRGDLAILESISGSLTGEQTVSGTLSLPGYEQYPVYQGDHEVTPSADTQVLSTAGKALFENIIITPIPSNYGKITWNGAVMTVS